jgi:cell division protein FtsB
VVRGNAAKQTVESNLAPASQVRVAPSGGAKAQQLIFPRRTTRLDAFYKLCIVLALVFGVVQAGRSVLSGMWKLTILMKNKPVIEEYHQAMVKERQSLLDHIARYSSNSGIEELARNNLGLVGKDEILVRIH